MKKFLYKAAVLLLALGIGAGQAGSALAAENIEAEEGSEEAAEAVGTEEAAEAAVAGSEAEALGTGTEEEAGTSGTVSPGESGGIGKSLSDMDTYMLRGIQIPLDEDDYRVGDYIGPGYCWQFVYHIYEKVWGEGFTPFPGTDDDMLRDYPLDQREINYENTRLFLRAAEPGAVIRIQDSLEGSDETEGSRHSFLLVAKDYNGCAIYHAWGGYSTLMYYTWKDIAYLFKEYIDFGYYKYIKFPDAPALEYHDETVEIERKG